MVWTVLALLVACSSAPPPAAPTPAPAPPSTAPAAPAPGAPAVSTEGGGLREAAAIATEGGAIPDICEASTIVPWNGGWLVGDNEDKKRLHAYGLDFTPRGPVSLPTEVDDIEALALAGTGYWVVGSHSTNKDGEVRPTRERLLAPNGTLSPLALATCPACVASRGLAPNDGGFNIEGAAWWGDRLWLGLRAPLSASGAAHLLGVDGTGEITELVELDLGGLGIREMIPHGDGLLLVAGPATDTDAAHQLYRLGPDRVPTRLGALPPSTEGIAVDPADPGQLVYVTDGDGKPGKCKDPARWGRTALPE